jgi:hypothetical protein
VGVINRINGTIRKGKNAIMTKGVRMGVYITNNGFKVRPTKTNKVRPSTQVNMPHRKKFIYLI